MFFILPFRTKNPPEGFPYFTLSIIAANFLVYFLTTHDLIVTSWAVADLAVSHNNLSLLRLITAMFLHASPMHILMNMLFLWLFGPAVEGRLKAWRFGVIYFTAGIIGGLLFELIVGSNAPNMPSLGASGAIMGVLGAYMYIFPFSQISVFWIFIIRFGVVQVQALWFIGFYVLQDILYGLILQANDGTGHVAHLAGFALGYVVALMFQPHTDSRRHSDAKSMLSEMKDTQLLTLSELDVLAQQPNADANVILAYCGRAAAEGFDGDRRRAVDMLQRTHRSLVEQSDPAQLAAYLLRLPPNEAALPSLAYIRLGSRLEQAGHVDLAYRIYGRLYDIDQAGSDTETALFRMARLLETSYGDSKAALETYSLMIERFPAGSRALEGRSAIAHIRSKLVFPPSANRPDATPKVTADAQPMKAPDPTPKEDKTNTELGSRTFLEL